VTARNTAHLSKLFVEVASIFKSDNENPVRRMHGERARSRKMPATHTGGCQCGNVRYEVQADINEVMACNCSRCGRLGSLLTFVATSNFKLLKGEGATSEYQFNRHNIHHLFCSTCGIQSFARGKRPDGTAVVAINVRCVDDIDLDKLTVKKIDGRKF